MNTAENDLPAPAPPVLPPAPDSKASSARQFLAGLLSLCLGLFLADAAVSLLDDSATLLFGVHVFSTVRLIVGLFAVLLVVFVYVLMAFAPAIPKRLFVPLALFYLVTQLIGLPVVIFYFARQQQIALAVSFAQAVLGVWILHRAQRGLKFGWSLVPLDRLGSRRFNWRNLLGFSAANIFGLLPAVLLYLFVCLAGLVDHFTDGFMTLHPRGFTVQVKKYARADGKTVQLFPMAHVAEADFYEAIAQTFPTNSVILMEGVTDEKHLLKHKINYQRMARALGLAEQHEKFAPTRGEMVPADIDVSAFSTNTLDLLNLVILIHAGGADAATLQQAMQFSAAPDFMEQLFNDLLQKRNQHLEQEIQGHLLHSDYLVVPWGVAHMPGVAREIQKSGFHLVETKEYTAIRFFGFGKQNPVAGQHQEKAN